MRNGRVKWNSKSRPTPTPLVAGTSSSKVHTLSPLVLLLVVAIYRGEEEALAD